MDYFPRKSLSKYLITIIEKWRKYEASDITGTWITISDKYPISGNGNFVEIYSDKSEFLW